MSAADVFPPAYGFIRATSAISLAWRSAGHPERVISAIVVTIVDRAPASGWLTRLAGGGQILATVSEEDLLEFNELVHEGLDFM